MHAILEKTISVNIPAGVDTYQNYIGVQSVKYKEVKPTKTNPPFIYKLIQKAELKLRTREI